jgi:hypothetical protein
VDRRPTTTPDATADVAAVLRRARADLGSWTGVADLLGVPRRTVDAWRAGDAGPTAAQVRVLRDLARVAQRLRQLPTGRVPAGWWRLPCRALDGASPEDVLVVDGAGRVLDAIERELDPGAVQR